MQPTRIEPTAVCREEEVRLYPPPGASFPAFDAGSRVLFAPCGVPGDVVEWTPASIKVKVPREAVSGPVWIASGVAGEAAEELDRGRSCVRSVAQHEVVPERLQTVCEPYVGDPFDPQAATLLRGVAVSASAPDGIAPQRAGEPKEGDPPACRVIGLDRRAPLNVKAQKNASLINGTGGSGGCFETCFELRTNKNHLTVNTPPEITRFLPAHSRITPSGVHEVEPGMNRIEWSVLPGADSMSLTFSTSTGYSEAVLPEDGAMVELLEPIEFTLKGENACGESEATFASTLGRSLRLSPELLQIRAGTARTVTMRVPVAFPADVRVALDESSGGLLAIEPPVATLPAGARELVFTVRALDRAGILPERALLGFLTARALAPSGDLLCESPEPIRVELESGGSTPSLGPTDTRVTGTLRYRECFDPASPPLLPMTLDGSGCGVLAGTSVFRPIRQARVEIWDQSGPIHRQITQVETDDEGRFRAVVPASGFYDVTVVASSFAGQVNFTDNAFTWFWKARGMPQAGVAGGGIDLSFDFISRSDAQHFNALDAITRGLEYAVLRSGVAPADIDSTFRKTVVIPKSAGGLGVTLRVGHATHIWLPADTVMFTDETLLHEYGHHMQHANGTYIPWASFHNGCYATQVAGPACRGRQVAAGGIDTAGDFGCWINSPQFAWFEGFPDYLTQMVMDFDEGQALTPTVRANLPFDPVTATCPLVASGVTHFNQLNQPITGAAVENHVAGALRQLVLRTDIVPGGAPSPGRHSLEETIFRMFTGPLSHSEPTIAAFEAQWLATFSASPAWIAMKTAFGFP